MEYFGSKDKEDDISSKLGRKIKRIHYFQVKIMENRRKLTRDVSTVLNLLDSVLDYEWTT